MQKGRVIDCSQYIPQTAPVSPTHIRRNLPKAQYVFPPLPEPNRYRLVKPQIAMYEQFGIEGLAVFQRTVSYCKEKGLIVIGDVKRGDIGSTSEAYAIGHLGKVQIGSPGKSHPQRLLHWCKNLPCIPHPILPHALQPAHTAAFRQ